MRTALFFSLALLAVVLFAPRPADAQSLLERLENRLNQALNSDQPADNTNRTPPTAPVRPPQENDSQPGYLGAIGDVAPGGEGVEILSIRGGSPAETSGLLPGDVITAVGRNAVASLDHLSALLQDAKAGDKLEFQVLRNGQRETIPVTLGAPPAVDQQRGPLNETLPPPPAADPGRPSLGVVVTPATEAVRERFGLTVRRGAVISEITPGGVADRYGLPIGAAIVAFDGIRVDAPGDLVALIGGAQLGQEVELVYYDRDRLQRKTVRLAPAAAPPHLQFTPPPTDPPLQLGRPGGRRGPLLDRLEGVLDNIVRPQVGAPPQVAVPPQDTNEVAALRQRVADLEQQLADVQQELANLKNQPAPANPDGDP